MEKVKEWLYQCIIKAMANARYNCELICLTLYPNKDALNVTAMYEEYVSVSCDYKIPRNITRKDIMECFVSWRYSKGYANLSVEGSGSSISIWIDKL